MDNEKKEKTTEEKLQECEKQRDEYLAGWQRSRADLLNYKKDELERIAGLLKYAGEETVLKILPILDSFQKAEKEIPEEKKDDYLKGLLQIKKQMEDFLKSQGVEEIKTANEKFDPNFHEVVEGVDGGESGIIVEEVQKGYLLDGKVIRPAKVKVSK